LAPRNLAALRRCMCGSYKLPPRRLGLERGFCLALTCVLWAADRRALMACPGPRALLAATATTACRCLLLPLLHASRLLDILPRRGAWRHASLEPAPRGSKRLERPLAARWPCSWRRVRFLTWCGLTRLWREAGAQRKARHDGGAR
jgi:hypothetical protein